MKNEMIPDEKNTNNNGIEPNPATPAEGGSGEDIQKELLKQVEELKNQVNDLKSEMKKGMPNEMQDKPQTEAADNQAAKKKKRFGWLKELLFYAVLVVVIVGAFFIRSSSDGRPMLIGGFSAFVVQTGSMQAEIPKGSLVITRQVDPKTLQVGDDITFMANQTATITHRIIGITENFNETGQRAFETQGIMNKTPDKNPVPAANVVGKVIFHSEVVGLMAGFVGEHWPIILFAMVVIAGLFFILKRINSDDEKTKPKKKAAVSADDEQENNSQQTE